MATTTQEDPRRVITSLAAQVMSDYQLQQDPRWLIRHHEDPLLGHVLYQILERYINQYLVAFNEAKGPVDHAILLQIQGKLRELILVD